MIEFKCPCGKYLKLPHSYAGKETQCPGCLRTLTVPGAREDKPAPAAPKGSTPKMLLCVDCGGSFPSGDTLLHNGQVVCTNCFQKRKPVVLKYRKKRSRKFKVLLWCGIIAAVCAAAVVITIVAANW